MGEIPLGQYSCKNYYRSPSEGVFRFHLGVGVTQKRHCTENGGDGGWGDTDKVVKYAHGGCVSRVSLSLLGINL